MSLYINLLFLQDLPPRQLFASLVFSPDILLSFLFRLSLTILSFVHVCLSGKDFEPGASLTVIIVEPLSPKPGTIGANRTRI
jgi:hypothetical protein